MHMSKDLILSFKHAISKAFAELYDHELPFESVKLEKTNPSFEGSFTFVVFPYLRVTKSKPEAAAEAIGQYVLSSMDEVKATNVVKGFLNFEITDNYWISYISRLLQSERLGTLNGTQFVLHLLY